MTTHARPLCGALLGLHARTSLHPGSGTALGAVDLPIQREKHTGWPMIQGSSLKGVLRDACREQVKAEYGGDRYRANADADLATVFGPAKFEAAKEAGNADAAKSGVSRSEVLKSGTARIEAGDDTAWAGALSVTDARILAFPVRSLKGVFAWVTCPAVLQRLRQDAEIAGVPLDPLALCVKSDTVIAGDALAVDDPASGAAKKRVIFEEFDFELVPDGGALDTVAELIAMLGSPPTAEVGSSSGSAFIKAHLAIVHDDDFTHFVMHATEVTARIGLDYETKTVHQGALFYQEFLPPETIMYAVLLADASRSVKPKESDNKESIGKKPMKNDDVFAYIVGTGNEDRSRKLPRFIQIGGDETTGKGLCATKTWSGNHSAGGSNG